VRRLKPADELAIESDDQRREGELRVRRLLNLPTSQATKRNPEPARQSALIQLQAVAGKANQWNCH
jgi:hypothetical protein